MIVLGLTGSIGMGKSTTARMFAEAGIPVHDSDETVHRLYSTSAAPLIEAAFPGTVQNGVVNRGELGKHVLNNPAAMKVLESIVHPLVRADSEAFIERHRKDGAQLVVLDIPLLFETDQMNRVDKIAVVSAPEAIQMERVLARPGMTPEKFAAIHVKQLPDDHKRRRADFVINTGLGMDHTRCEVAAIIAELTG